MTRYFNVTLIDDRGAYTFTQILTDDQRVAFDYIEAEMASRTGRGDNRPLVAAFICDTRDNTLRHYIINGLRARIVTDVMFE